MSKIIVTAALTGVAANRDQCPHIPYTVEEIAEEARRACEAGAAVVHIHAREDEGQPSFRKERYQEIQEAIQNRSEVLINFSTGAIGVPLEQRMHHLDIKPDIGALNMGSMNYAKYSQKTKKFYFETIFQNPFSEICQFLERMNANGVVPELECFDCGQIANSAPLIDLKLLRPPFHFSLILGVLGGIPATPQNLFYMIEQIPAGSQWEVIGISHNQWKLIGAALSVGGNIRVGLEDNFYLHSGVMATSNGELVEKAVRMARDMGHQPASPEEARKLLGIT